MIKIEQYSPAKRVMINTVALNVKLAFSLLIGLYSSRILLQALGISDFGLYGLVAGATGMLSFITMPLTFATMRFTSVAMGTKDKEKIREIFNTTNALYVFIGIGLVVLLEIIGLYMINYVFKIPSDRLFAANIIYQFVLVDVYYNMTTISYQAIIRSNENLIFLSLTELAQTIMRLGIAFAIYYYPSDKLILYAALITLSSLLLRIVVKRYCYRNYDYCTLNYRAYFSKSLAKEMFTFSSWSLIENTSSTANSQGKQIAINYFFGTIANGAQSISNQLNSHLGLLSSSFLSSINPQIYKSYGEKNWPLFNRYIDMVSKLGFMMFSLIAVPVFFEMEPLIQLWLKQVPEYVVGFSRLLIIGYLIKQLSYGVRVGASALGSVRAMAIINSVLTLINLTFSVLLLYFGYSIYTVYIPYIVVEFVGVFLRVGYYKKDLHLSGYIVKAVLPTLFALVLTMAALYLCKHHLIPQHPYWALNLVVGFFITLTIFYFVALNKYDRTYFRETFGKILAKFKPTR